MEAVTIDRDELTFTVVTILIRKISIITLEFNEDILEMSFNLTWVILKTRYFKSGISFEKKKGQQWSLLYEESLKEKIIIKTKFTILYNEI